ncbi:MAG: L,D-transpeptidase, partial [Alphaproteobacteria bacterium]|nr:L,D-transpeptidase [Alphaproteobacteria bacterium]
MKKRRKLVIDVEQQKARLYEGRRLKETFNISTAKNGLGNKAGSFRTPAGKLRVAEKIGGGLPLHTIFSERVAAGLWDGRERDGQSPVIGRILWLEGAERHNRNTKERCIYLHGTSHAGKLGQPNSQGCIVFAPEDIVR